MHIIHLETGRHLYGGARQVLMLLEGLAAAGVESTLVCPDDSAIATAVDTGRTRLVTLPMRGELDVRFGVRLLRRLAREDADLLHVHSRRGADLWGGLAADRARLPAILTRRVDNPAPPLIGRARYRMYARVIAISDAIRRQVLSDGATERQVTVVRSAIDAESCQPTWSRADFLATFGFSEQHLIVVCVAQFIPRKGHPELLTAWQQVAQSHPDARLLLLGLGRDENAIRQLADRRGLSESVRFGGFRRDLREFLGRADVLVHPARAEGLGICLLEAQAAGLPIVATQVGGIPEAVQKDQTGLLVRPGNTRALAEALERLLGDAGLRRRFGQAGAAWVCEHFSPGGMVSGNLAIYKDLLQQAR